MIVFNHPRKHTLKKKLLSIAFNNPSFMIDQIIKIDDIANNTTNISRVSLRNETLTINSLYANSNVNLMYLRNLLCSIDCMWKYYKNSAFKSRVSILYFIVIKINRFHVL